MNYSNYQGLGYANMLYPGLRKIYDDDDQLRDALKENVEFFQYKPEYGAVYRKPSSGNAGRRCERQRSKSIKWH